MNLYYLMHFKNYIYKPYKNQSRNFETEVTYWWLTKKVNVIKIYYAHCPCYSFIPSGFIQKEAIILNLLYC